MFHPSGAEPALAMAGAALFTWAATPVVLVVSTAGSILAGVQLKRRTGSTMNLIVASFFLAVASFWATFMTAVLFATIKEVKFDNVVFIAGPGALMMMFCLSWFGAALVARLRRLPPRP